MKKTIRKIAMLVLLLLILPYIVTVFLNHEEMGTYAGSCLKQVRVKSGNTVNKMEWDDYFVRVLAEEADVISEEEAWKAQAILIRTTLFRELAEDQEKVLDLEYMTDHEMEKIWGKKKAKKLKKQLERICAETEDEILVYDEKPAFTPFHLLSNGNTRDGIEAFGKDTYPYLKSKKCPKDIESELEFQTLTLTYKELKEYCKPFLLAVDKKNQAQAFRGKDFEIIKTDSQGYVIKLRIGEHVYSGEKFREALHLPSGCFALQDHGKTMKITTKGVGHGVGMSQYTANEMAKEGKTCDEILKYFYDGTEKRQVANNVLSFWQK